MPIGGLGGLSRPFSPSSISYCASLLPDGPSDGSQGEWGRGGETEKKRERERERLVAILKKGVLNCNMSGMTASA